MKKISILFLVILLCFTSSCEIAYDGEKRLVFNTKIVDTNNQSLSDVTVKVYGDGSTSIFDTDGINLISQGKTNENGELELVFPSPIEERRISIYINEHNYNDDFINTKQEKRIYNIKPSDFNNYKLTLNPLVLYENQDVTSLDIKLIQSNANNQITAIEVDAIHYNIDFNPDTEIQTPYFELYYYVIKNQNATIIYSIKNLETNEENTLEDNINIGDTNYTHTINY